MFLLSWSIFSRVRVAYSFDRVSISTPSSSSSAAGTSSRPAPSSLAHLPVPPALDKQSTCAKSITEIIKEHFVESLAKRYRLDPMHERAIRDAWEKWASLHCKDLLYDVQVDGYHPNWMMVAQYTSLCDVWSSNDFKKKQEAVQRNRLQGRGDRGPTSTLAAGENRQGICTIRVVRLTASAKQQGPYLRFGSQSVAITAKRQGGNSSSSSILSISFAAAQESCIEGEKRLWGYMQQTQDRFNGFARLLVCF
ncbi:hypothetical protein M9H77_25845 [Catharanthus roseus]|uniref:Uncharacterized protein n=1 Tax=Catharanthus roseus TaxID=4058 RepID=A0ACC0A9C5_CATRO|nr:hypothetical protein M9H77_25845 [Catharanthus roseus]